MARESIVIATQQLNALVDTLGHSPTPEQRLGVGMLAAQVELARRLAGIERSLDLGLSIRTSPE